MEIFLSIVIGLGLSAACGFRVFVPLLLVSVAARTGHLALVESFAWMAGDAALITFAVATVLEIGAYYIPWLDNFLDSVATPAAVVAGVIITASVVGDVSPFLKWSLAIIAGGGAAGAVKGAAAVTRAASTATTGGLGNPLVATVELGGSVLGSLLAIFVPLLGLALLLAAGAVFVIYYRRRRRRLQAAGASLARPTPAVG